MEKMDGSMIRPILVDGYLRLATKMGLSDQALQAEQWLAAKDDRYKGWLLHCVKNGITPIFEWVSPFNQIVLAYEESDLVLLACRDNTTGEYSMPNYEDGCPFTIVPRYGSVDGNLEDYIARQREQKNREGDIIRFANGHMLKVKNDWYVRIHKALDRVRFDRNIVGLIINEDLDDVVSLMPQPEIDRIRAFETRFWESLNRKHFVLLSLLDEAETFNSRKEVALKFVPTLQDRADASFIFRALDGHNVRELLFEHIRKNISTNTKWESCAQWLGLE
jgi:T4 RnlA family RNA ligase